MEKAANEFTIMIVEDNPADVILFQEALREVRDDVSLEVCPDGFCAWARLEEAAHGLRARPGLMVLDLNVPGMSGRDILAELRGRAALKDLAVAVLTGSVTDDEIVTEFPEVRLLFLRKTFLVSELKAHIREMLAFAGCP